MGSPKHLWSGDWEEESAAAAARRRGATRPPADTDRAEEPPPAPRKPKPKPQRTSRARPSPRVAAAGPRRRVHLSKEEVRRWATAGAVALVAAFVIVSAVNLITRGDSRDTSATHGQAARSGSGAYLGVELRGRAAGEVVVTAVVPGSPADTAGLLPGDQILGIDNTTVTSATDVTDALSRAKPGQVVAVSAARGAAGFTVQVTVAARPSGQAVP